MASTFTLSYFANHDLLGVVSEEEYERFKEQLLQAFPEEWPDAAVSVDDDEDEEDERDFEEKDDY